MKEGRKSQGQKAVWFPPCAAVIVLAGLVLMSLLTFSLPSSSFFLPIACVPSPTLFLENVILLGYGQTWETREKHEGARELLRRKEANRN